MRKLVFVVELAGEFTLFDFHPLLSKKTDTVGSGKSSFLLTLLRMTEIRQGNITIYGQDIKEIEPDKLRARLTTIPQDPFFLPGTIRLNLDPTETSSDEQMIAALRGVNLFNVMETSFPQRQKHIITS